MTGRILGMTDYDYDEYREVMNQALKTMNELLDDFEHMEVRKMNDTDRTRRDNKFGIKTNAN